MSEEAARQALSRAVHTATARGVKLNWVFQGPPGVGKGTYASRAAEALGVPHIATGDLVRAEVSAGSDIGHEIAPLINAGKLIGDEQASRLVETRLARGAELGEHGVLLDGYPRTVPQARRLLECTTLAGVLNMRLREDVLVEKCTGRRRCTHCGANYNVADIQKGHGPNGEPPVTMPPLSPAPECEAHLQKRSDDTEEVVRERLRVYHEEVRSFLIAFHWLIEVNVIRGGGMPTCNAECAS
jgi:adenylate kinase